MSTGADRSGSAAPIILEAARNGEYDRAMAALLAPSAARESLLALAAFSAELVRITPQTRREPHMGEIRLQWWREALADPKGAPSGHPIADAMKAAMARNAWAVSTVEGIIDSHAHDGLADAFADDGELIATLELGEGALFRLAAGALGAAQFPELDALAEDAGVAYGIARRLVALPQLVALGHVPLPQARVEAAGLQMPKILAGEADVAGVVLDLADLARDRLASARQALNAQTRKIRIAFLPLALVDPYLRISTQKGRQALRDPVDVAPLRRLIRLLRARLSGRI
ncbi:MAG: hypothetical protein EKK41_26285 [Hyphomicrobiales bacterium]|nr:MAG: hypothetical protein EKK41_26285 [Hyphomicrobiales bacterium]